MSDTVGQVAQYARACSRLEAAPHRHWAGKLALLVSLSDHGNPLRRLTTAQARIWLAARYGRVPVEIVVRSKSGHQYVEGCQARQPTLSEIAHAEGLSLKRVRELIADADAKVQAEVVG